MLRLMLHDHADRPLPHLRCVSACSSHDPILSRNGASGKPGAVQPGHFSPHCLRHTFASLLLQQGESAAYVQRQLGHASIKLTVDTYGKWLPMGNKAAVDRPDDASGSKVVAIEASGADGVCRKPAKQDGEPWWDRTTDPLIKSQVLCQLS